MHTDGMTEPVTLDRLHELLDDETIPLPHRVLWMLLWQGGADDEGGLRLGDLLSLDVRDVDWEARELPVDFPKSEREPRAVRFSEQALAGLRKVVGDRAEGPLFVDASGCPLSTFAVAQAAQRAGVSIHGFRRGRQAVRHAETAVGQ